ncbi:MAG TPA: FHA domain-containing protein [Acidimicrobiia bacterium]|nr:FHA domain-containing protein [Acidimicrobiia bacterium]
MSTESLLTVLKFCFLALLYLFLARVVRVVVAELRADRVVVEPPVKPAETARAQPPRKERRRAPVLHILEPATRAGEVFPLDGEITVGRGGGCQVVLADDTFVSQVHARVFTRDGRAYVEDLGSRNGTFVNGKRIDVATRLRRGDRVQFGQTVAEVGA